METKAQKSKACSDVLRLMDVDFDYKDAIEIVLMSDKHKDTNKEDLEKELDLYI